jgi:hypothetical protein
MANPRDEHEIGTTTRGILIPRSITRSEPIHANPTQRIKHGTQQSRQDTFSLDHGSAPEGTHDEGGGAQRCPGVIEFCAGDGTREEGDYRGSMSFIVASFSSGCHGNVAWRIISWLVVRHGFCFSVSGPAAASQRLHVGSKTQKKKETDVQWENPNHIAIILRWCHRSTSKPAGREGEKDRRR